MIGRASLLMLFALALGSCSYTIPVRAEFRSGALYFVGDDTRATSFPHCLSMFRLVYDAGTVAWEFELPLEQHKMMTKCGPNLPLRYGVAPKGARVIVPAKPLQHGKTYVISGLGTDSYTGAFRYERRMVVERRVTNVEPDPAIVDRALGAQGGMDLLEPTEAQ